MIGLLAFIVAQWGQDILRLGQWYWNSKRWGRR